MKIQANKSGTRSIEVAEGHLQTIEKYALLDHLVDSTGYVDEDAVEKLKRNTRALLENAGEDTGPLLDLCLDVVYNTDMKATGLQNLIALYNGWKAEQGGGDGE